MEKTDPVHMPLSKADDAAGTDRDARLSDTLDGVEPVLVFPGRGDLLVVFWGRVEVVVVRGETLRGSDNVVMSELIVENSSPVNQLELTASLSSLACSGVSIPSVVQTSMSRARIFLTASSTLCHCPLPTCDGPLQAAPMQKRVEPASLARTAASYTSSRSMSFSALVPVSLLQCDDWLQ